MRTWVTAATVLVLVLAFSAGAEHEHGVQAAAGKELEATGEVVDLHCFQHTGARGPGHLECARKCAAAGQPLGLVDETGKVYQLEAGEKPSKLIKLANFGLHHALMCVNLPLEAVGMVTDTEMPQLEAKVQGPKVEPQADWLAQEVKVKGRVTSDGETPVLAIAEARVLGPAPEVTAAGHTCDREQDPAPVDQGDPGRTCCGQTSGNGEAPEEK